jgi:hypothetical protein
MRGAKVPASLSQKLSSHERSFLPRRSEASLGSRWADKVQKKRFDSNILAATALPRPRQIDDLLAYVGVIPMRAHL